MIVEEFLKTYAEVLLHGSWLVVGIALVAGLLSSAICPFTLPVGLGIVGVVGTAESRICGTGFPIAMAFFAGLVLSLTALGALAGVLGFVATQAIGQWWMLIMAALAFVAALAVLAGPSVTLPACRAFLASHPQAELVLVGTATSRFSVPPLADALHPRALVVHGEDDDVVPLAATLDWARPQSLPITVVPHAGHFFHGKLPLLKGLVLRHLAA